MQVPPEISVKNVRMTTSIEQQIQKGIARLEKVCDYIISTRIALEKSQARRRTGNPYRMRIDITVPERPEIVVKRVSRGQKKLPDGLSELQAAAPFTGEPEAVTTVPVRRSPLPRRGIREEPVNAMIRRTFDSAQRELEKVVEKQRREVKTPAAAASSAVVERIFRDEGYGFLRTEDGQQIYFHKNSLLHRHWDTLAVGTVVRYAGELGEKGLQASTVEPIEKLGEREMHDVLHDLPRVASLRRRTKLGTRQRAG